ncbi:DUF5316 family protein [Alkalibacillus haloalkaliphilus]|uniref:DUF5316 family protein n=1 Tax=Alkalibacillus haloalkaliphilus TaxID=94136 RepID=UPI0034DF0E61
MNYKGRFIIKKFSYVGFGLAITVVALLIGTFTGDWNVPLTIISVGAIVPLLIAGILTGALNRGDRVRANYHTETQQDRYSRDTWIKRLLFISSPNATLLVLMIIIGLLTY